MKLMATTLAIVEASAAYPRLVMGAKDLCG